MNKSEIQAVVRETIQELQSRGVIQKSAIDVQQAYQITGQRLKAYYSGKADTALEEALDMLKNDVYFGIIPMYYKDGLTLDAISKKMFISEPTAKRQKKRLCIEIYSELY